MANGPDPHHAPANIALSDDEELPGLAGERTDMAWSRSGLAVLSCLAAIAKRFLPNLNNLSATGWVVSALVVGTSGWIIGLFWARLAAATSMSGRLVANETTLRVVAYGTAMLAAVALGVALIS